MGLMFFAVHVDQGVDQGGLFGFIKRNAMRGHVRCRVIGEDVGVLFDLHDFGLTKCHIERVAAFKLEIVDRALRA